MVPNGWDYSTLESLCETDAPITYGVLKPGEYVADGVPLLQIKDLLLNLSKLESVHRISKDLDEQYRRSKIKTNDILISLVGTIGRIGIVPEQLNNANIHRNLGRIRAKNYEFLYHYLQSDIAKNRFGTSSSGSSQSALNLTVLRALKVPVPPLPEQQKIAKILTTWNKAISSTERLMENCKQQKKAFMQQLLTGKKRLLDDECKRFEGEWEEVRLEEIAKINPKKPIAPKDNLVSFINMDSVSEEAKLTKQEIKNYDEVSKGFTSFIDEDVLVAKITPCFENGKGAIVEGLKNGIGFGSTEFHVLRAKKGNHPDFIYALTLSHEFRNKGKLNMQGSAGHKRVTTDYMKLFKVLIPPTYKEQQKIAIVLTNADKEIELLEQQLVDLQQEKKALMQVLLTGKVRVVGDA